MTSRLVVTRAPGTRRAGEVCLVNRRNGLGFPGKAIQLRQGRHTLELTTGRGGCADVPAGHWRGARVGFPGDPAVRPSSTHLVPSRH